MSLSEKKEEVTKVRSRGTKAIYLGLKMAAASALQPSSEAEISERSVWYSSPPNILPCSVRRPKVPAIPEMIFHR
jgi:hypothetical protein